MTFFPLSFVTVLVYGALTLTALGVLMLLVLLAKDVKAGRLW